MARSTQPKLNQSSNELSQKTLVQFKSFKTEVMDRIDFNTEVMTSEHELMNRENLKMFVLGSLSLTN